MWRIVEFIFIIIVVLLFVTEIFIPVLADKPLFGSFKKTKDSDKNNSPADELSQKVASAKEKVEEVKSTQDEINKHYKSAQQLKDESDDLFN